MHVTLWKPLENRPVIGDTPVTPFIWKVLSWPLVRLALRLTETERLTKSAVRFALFSVPNPSLMM